MQYRFSRTGVTGYEIVNLYVYDKIFINQFWIEH